MHSGHGLGLQLLTYFVSKSAWSSRCVFEHIFGMQKAFTFTGEVSPPVTYAVPAQLVPSSAGRKFLSSQRGAKSVTS
jgi:hypothetical protein